MTVSRLLKSCAMPPASGRSTPGAAPGELLRQTLGLGHVADDHRGRGELAGSSRTGNAETAWCVCVPSAPGQSSPRRRRSPAPPRATRLLQRELRAAQPVGQDLRERPPEHVCKTRAPNTDLRWRGSTTRTVPSGRAAMIGSCADSTTAAMLRRCSSSRRSPRDVATDRGDPDDLPAPPPGWERSVKSMVRSVPSGASRKVSNVAEAPCRMLSSSSSRRSGVSAVLRGSMMSPR